MTLVTLLSNQAAVQTVVLDRLDSTAQVFLPTIIQAGGTQTITLDRLESTAQIFLPTITQVGNVQTITLNLLGSTSQIFLPTINLVGAVTDTSDILTRYRRRRSESKEEEEIAAQLLKARQKRPEVTKQYKDVKKWKKLLYEAIYGAETLSELDSINPVNIPTDSPEIVAAILAEIEQRKEAKRLELKLKMEEAALQASKLQTEMQQRIDEQQQAIQAIKQLQTEVMARHAIAEQAAIQAEMQAFLELQEAEKKAQEFTRKRNNRIKRLKALMWLAKLDL